MLFNFLKTKKLTIMKKSIITSIVCIFVVSPLFSQTDIEIHDEYPEARKEVKKALDDIEMYIRENRMDELIAMHAYGPKFTEFEMGGKRQGSKKMKNLSAVF